MPETTSDSDYNTPEPSYPPDRARGSLDSVHTGLAEPDSLQANHHRTANRAEETETADMNREMNASCGHSDSSESGKRQKNKWKYLLLFTIFLMGLIEFFGSSCFFSSVFGIPCAGCGSTRAALLLFEGKIGEALRMHPLIFITLFSFLTAFLFITARFIMKKRGKELRLPLSSRALDAVLLSLAALYLIVYLIRMILYFPHTEPMVYNHHSVWGRLISIIREAFSR